MFGWNSEEGWWFSWPGAIIFLVVLIYWLHKRRRRQERKKSLMHRSDGWYVWVELDGTTKLSQTHPEKPGGDWHNEDGDDDDSDGGD